MTRHPTDFTYLRRSKKQRITDALIEMILGDHIGDGVYRSVHHHATDPDSVIKIEHQNHEGREMSANSLEMIIWRVAEDYAEVQEDKKHAVIRDWLAPCKFISTCGRVLIQAKTKPIEMAPEMVPKFLRDTHVNNFGEYEGRPVCHDYGLPWLIGDLMLLKKDLVKNTR